MVIVGAAYTHQFVSAASGAVISGGDYEHTFVSVGVGTITIAGIGSTAVQMHHILLRLVT